MRRTGSAQNSALCHMNYEKISGFSDEISEQVEEQFSVLNQLNIKYFEARGIDGKNISIHQVKKEKERFVEFSQRYVSCSVRKISSKVHDPPSI